MELIGFILKYGFVLALAVEWLLVGRALWLLAVEKARPTANTPAKE